MSVLLDFVLVFVGGGIGSSLRYGMMFIPYQKEDLYGFSLITFLINLIGSFIIGFVAEISSEKLIGNHFTTFLKIGILGGFTTFSSFSLDNLEMIEKGHYVHDPLGLRLLDGDLPRSVDGQGHIQESQLANGLL